MRRSLATAPTLLLLFFLATSSAAAQGGPPNSSATFLRTDATTLGNWHAAYGADGYSIAGNGQSLPSYATFAIQNQEDYTWTSDTTDTRALQTADGSNRIAAVWYNASAFSFDVNFADGNSHQFALYALDWDSSGRAETIQIVDAASEAVLDTESISSFSNGVYLVWNVTGHVQINVITTAGNNAVVNGVFFGGSSVVSSMASFVRTDTSTQGNWHGTYGADGYSIANDSQSIPSYASFAVQNQQNFTWSNPPTDIRALETGNGYDRIASVWYNTPEFNFDVNLTDGNSHQFALYAVDWDNSGRAETIQILDAATDALLDTRSISNFTNGLFLVWNVTGHVKLNIIQTAGNNAVVSGVFFGANSTVSSSAAFLRTDTTTQGNWHGTYGSDGYSVANDSQSLPAYASFAVQSQQNFTWSNSPTDMRSLQTGSASGRIAAVWYNTPEFNFDVNFTDGNSHQFAFYAVDWDNSGRAETIQILDAATDALLDTRSISSFSNGLYLVWNVAGHVKVNVIQTAGNNAVISGVFFGGGSAINSTASFVATDTTTQGSWHGTYGGDGYSIANDNQSLPSYANFAVQNQANWTWLPLTTDPRALQTGSNSGNIAATWYNTPEFNLDVNLTDGQPHQLALYALDWDSSGRAETIELLDAATGALLDSRNISSFVNGLYLVWNVSGHVKFNIILTAGNNAVVSGVFWDPVPGSGGTNPVLQSISITPPNPSTGVGAALQFTALGTYSNGQTQNLNSSVTWSSSSSQAATVNASGIATSQAVGSTTISASLGAVSGSTVLTVTVNSPPTIIASVSPSPNAAGWNNSGVTVSFTCAGGSYAVASCPTPQFVNASGANQLVTGTVVDTAGLSASIDVSLNIEKSLPTIANVTPADQSVLTSPTGVITGSVVSSLTNVNGLTCNGSAASFTSGSFSCNFSVNPGVNLVTVLATDVAGNMAGTRLHLIYAAPLPAPSALQITPAMANVLVGAIQQFTVVDQLGRPRADAVWNVDNTNIATISTDSSPILTGVAGGTVTLTASVGGVSAQIQVNVLAGVSLPVGTTIWAAPLTPGFAIVRLDQAVPTSNGPAIYTVSTDDNGDSLIQAATSDGEQKWQQLEQPAPNGEPLLVQSLPDDLGGRLLFLCDPNLFQNACQLTDLDGQTGSLAWQYTSPHGFNGTPAIRQDGAVITIEYDQISYDNWLVMFNGTTGQRTPLLDLSPLGGGAGLTGPPSVDTNGNIYVLYDDLNGQNVDLLTIQPDGSVSKQQIATSPNLPYPGEVIPDGQGGQLATWTYQSGYLFPFELTHVTSQGNSTVVLPLNGDLEARGKVPYQLVIGENGGGYATDGATVVSFDTNSLQTNWSAQPASGVSSMNAISGGGVTITDNASNLIPIDIQGNLGTAVPNVSSASPGLLDSATWLGLQNAQLSLFAGPSSALASSLWPTSDGEPQNQGTATPTASVTVNFTGYKSQGDQLNFSGEEACSQDLGLWPCPESWAFYIEGVATVSDDASKWKIRQNAVIARVGNTKNAQGVLNPVNDVFNSNKLLDDDDPCVLNDPNPGCAGIVSVQQPSGQNTIYWLDHPGSLIQASADAVWDSLTENGLFTSKACNRFGICTTVKWFIKLQVDPGSIMNCSQSLDGLDGQPITCP